MVEIIYAGMQEGGNKVTKKMKVKREKMACA